MSEVTPEQIAAALTGGDDVNETLNGWVDVSTVEGNVAHITFTPIKATERGSDPDRENAKHFLAVVIKGETVPLILDRERYRDRIEEIVQRFTTALATSIPLDHPHYIARLRGALWDLAETAQAEQGGTDE